MKSLQSAAAAAVVVVNVVVGGTGCTWRCFESKGAVSATIDQGIAGVGVGGSDDCPGICLCGDANLSVAVATVDEVPADDAAAFDAVQAADVDAVRMTDAKYERPVDAGNYLVCDDVEFGDCVFVGVDEGKVTTVNLQASGSIGFHVWDGDGVEVKNPPTFRIEQPIDEGE